jgi:hypothetical protein
MNYFSPFHRFTVSPFHRFTVSPFHRFTVSPFQLRWWIGSLILTIQLFASTLNAQVSNTCTFPTNEITLCNLYGGELPDISITTPTQSINLPSGWDQKVVYINTLFTVNSPFTIENCNIKFGPFGQLLVVAGGELNCLGTKLFSCEPDGWQGIIASGGVLIMTACEIEDALNGILINNNNAQLVITYNKFNRNRGGIFVLSNVLANAFIMGNVFNATTNNFLGEKPLYGILVQNGGFATIGTPNPSHPKNRNVFVNQMTGISSNQAVSNILFAEFNCNAQRAIGAAGGTCNVKGINEYRNLFSKNLIDIVSSGTNLVVNRSDFRDCISKNILCGVNNNAPTIQINKFNYFETDNDNSINTSKKCIELQRSSGASDFVVRNLIEQNSFVIQDFNTNISRSAIRVVGSIGAFDVAKIWGNTILVNEGGSDSLNASAFSPIVDVEINQAKNFNVQYNTIVARNPDDPSFGYRWGFYLHDWESPSSGNWISNNTVLGQSTGATQYDHGMCAFHFHNTGPWNICDNHTDFTLRGFHFSGTCGVSVFGGNQIGHHRRSFLVPQNSGVPLTGGLYFEPNGSIGTQVCRHNRWLAADYLPDRGALHLSNDPSGSRFIYNPTITGEIPNTLTPDMGWFVPFCTESDSFLTHCGEPQEFEPRLDEFETDIIATNQIHTTAGNAKSWEDRRRALSKLINYPELKSANSPADSFYNAYINASEGLYCQYDVQLQEAMQIDVGLLTSLESIRSQINLVVARVDSLDATLDLDNLNADTAFFTCRKNIIAPLASLISAQLGLEFQIDSVRNLALIACSDVADLLPVSTVYEANQSFLNKMLLKKLKGFEFSTADLNQLRVIAQMCADIAGTTRDKAMNLLPEGDLAIYRADVPNYSGCLDTRQSPDKTSSDFIVGNLGITLNPNPASELLNVIFSQSFTGRLEVLDVSGRICTKLELKEQVQHSIKLEGYASGLYYLSVLPDSGFPTVEKFVIR